MQMQVAWAALIAIGCSSTVMAQQLDQPPHDTEIRDTAGADRWEPQVQRLIGQLLDHEAPDPQTGPHEGVFTRKKICFMGLQNKGGEELGDFGESICERLEASINKSGRFEVVNRHTVEAALRQCKLRPDDLYIPAILRADGSATFDRGRGIGERVILFREQYNLRMFLAELERAERSVDYFLYATMTSEATCRAKRDSRQAYLLTLELMNSQTLRSENVSAQLHKGSDKRVSGKQMYIMNLLDVTPVDPESTELAPALNVGGGLQRTEIGLMETSEPLPGDAQALVSVFDGEAVAMRQKVEQEIQKRRQTLINALQALQDGYTRDAKLDEAVAIRDMIRRLKVSHLNPQPNPGNLTKYQDRIGEVLYFDIVGHANAMIWGSEVYTCNSDLATAAVHAGVLKSGQRGIVKVTIVKSPEAHRGSTQHGISSSTWGSYLGSYAVESPQVNPASVERAKPAPVIKWIPIAAVQIGK